MKISRANGIFQLSYFHMSCPRARGRALASIGIFVFYAAAILATGPQVLGYPLAANDSSAKPPAIIIGFVGGFISHDNPVHSEVQLAARLRKEYPAGVQVQTYESYRGELARKDILKLLDTHHDGTLTTAEKQEARIVIYGHSWGGAEAIYLARMLEKDGIPVLLTIQVDSISAPGKDDTTIPGNVAQAANFYQDHGLLSGHHDIRAADPARTRIIGSFKLDYENSALTCSEYPWYDRVFVKPHTQIECDPAVWNQVDALIHKNLIL